MFSVLCNEVTLLKNELYEDLLPAFLFYGEDGPLMDKDNSAIDTNNSSSNQSTIESISNELPRPPLVQGEAQVMMGMYVQMCSQNIVFGLTLCVS